jgi:hypothetical protein
LYIGSYAAATKNDVSTTRTALEDSINSVNNKVLNLENQVKRQDTNNLERFGAIENSVTRLGEIVLPMEQTVSEIQANLPALYRFNNLSTINLLNETIMNVNGIYELDCWSNDRMNKITVKDENGKNLIIPAIYFSKLIVDTQNKVVTGSPEIIEHSFNFNAIFLEIENHVPIELIIRPIQIRS